jgi:hypothetical protein
LAFEEGAGLENLVYLYRAGIDSSSLAMSEQGIVGNDLYRLTSSPEPLPSDLHPNIYSAASQLLNLLTNKEVTIKSSHSLRSHLGPATHEFHSPYGSAKANVFKLEVEAKETITSQNFPPFTCTACSPVKLQLC